MTVKIHPNGLGATTGDTLGITPELYTTQDAWYVDSATGTDATGNAGKERKQPLATVAQAVTNASAGDMIVFFDGHAETLTATQAVSKAGLVFMGEGKDSSQRPTVKFTPNVAGELFEVTGAGVQFRNLWIAANLTQSTDERIDMGAAYGKILGCYFECAGDDEAPAVLYSASGLQHLENTTFISTATAVTDLPSEGVKISEAIFLYGSGNVFDGGTVGFTLGYAFREASANWSTAMRLEQTQLLCGADMEVVHDGGAEKIITLSARTGGARIVTIADTSGG